MVLVIIVDGCNEDYLTATDTPFLHKLKASSAYISMTTTPGFANRVEILTGKFPETTGTFVDFCRGKRRAFMPTAANTPRELVPYFTVNQPMIAYKRAEKKRQPNNLLGILEHSGYRARFVYGTTARLDRVVRREALAGKKVVFLHYGETDHIGHEKGPSSSEIKEALRRIDHSIETAYRKALPHLDGMFVLSDHGMADITATVNIWEQLQRLDVRPAKDYLVFLNSPMVRFWFENERAERTVRTFLESLHPYGRIVAKSELKERRLPTDDRFGTLIFWARRGVHFCPDFYHRSPLKGMHGYFDQTTTVPYIIWARGPRPLSKNHCIIQDVAPTLLDFVGIPPGDMEGKSLIEP
jgi:predicted AlkP superfamily pyrophosphatase or phosphodiesterase